MNKRASSRGGFTLIEVIGALVIFAGGVLVAVALSDQLTEQMTRSTLRGEAATVARQTLDSLSTVPFAEFSLGEEENEVMVSGRTYTRRWTVSDSGFRSLEIVIEVEPGGGLPHRTYVVEPW